MTTQSGNTLLPKVTDVSTCIDSTHPGPPYRIGGPLGIYKTTFDMVPSASAQCSNLAHSTWYKGSFYVSCPSATGWSVTPLTQSELLYWGTKGYNRALPVHNLANLALAAVELKDYPGMIKSTKEFFAQFSSHAFSGKSAKFWSDAYLNASFGWRPFLNDLWSILNYQNSLAARLQKLRDHNGKPVHRRLTLFTDSYDRQLSTLDSLAPCQPVLNSTFYDQTGAHRGNLSTFERYSRHIWFEGVFTYHLPGIHGSLEQDSRLKAKLLGLMPDLNLIYKATPWTWLGDFFTSAGAMINTASLSMQYSQIARYAFLMAETKTVRTTYAFQYSKVGTINVPPVQYQLVSAHSSTTKVSKQRTVANPYGFGVSWDGLNSFQLSILATLGVSRAHSGS